MHLPCIALRNDFYRALSQWADSQSKGSFHDRGNLLAARILHRFKKK
jgi:hypothetical protein